jgi:hypothetical protein
LNRIIIIIIIVLHNLLIASSTVNKSTFSLQLSSTVVHAYFISRLQNSIQWCLFFWNAAPCRLVEIYRRFRGAYWLIAWWWRQEAPLKRQSISTRLHSATSQRTVIFILVAVRTLNLTNLYKVRCFTMQHARVLFVQSGFIVVTALS